MILSDKDILDRLYTGDLVISPLDDPKHQVQPASVDLRLQNVECSVQNPLSGAVGDGVKWLLSPGGFALATTVERVAIPPDLVAFVHGKSSLGRKGLFVENAGLVDSGFEGQITLELFNGSKESVLLTPGMKICQLVLQRLTSPADRPYGHPSRKSRYQGQVGVTPSKEEVK